MPTIQKNLDVWSRHHWSHDGDEWNTMADKCGVPYDEWKSSLIDATVGDAAGKTVLEIGCGHGRWTRMISRQRCRKLIAVDLVAANLAYCRKILPQVEYICTSGPMPEIGERSIDLVWSFDTFVHIEPPETAVYLREFRRVLKPGGRAVIHHADCQDRGGWRSALTGRVMRDLAIDAGLVATHQIDSWGEGHKANCREAGDVISFVAAY